MPQQLLDDVIIRMYSLTCGTMKSCPIRMVRGPGVLMVGGVVSGTDKTTMVWVALPMLPARSVAVQVNDTCEHM